MDYSVVFFCLWLTRIEALSQATSGLFNSAIQLDAIPLEESEGVTKPQECCALRAEVRNAGQSGKCRSKAIQGFQTPAGASTARSKRACMVFVIVPMS